MVIVAGQPGAGKSVAQAAVLAQLGHSDAVAIDVDDLRTYHPRYESLALADDRTAAAYTQRDAQRWLRMCIAEAISHRFNIVLSTTLADPGHAEALLNRFREAGYTTQVAFLAVHELHSRLGVLDRYQHDQTTIGWGRYAPTPYQRSTYTGMLASADHIDQHRLADDVRVLQRDGHHLYRNHLLGGQWQQPPDTRNAIERGRAASLSTGTGTAHIFNRSAVLAQSLPADLHGNLADLLADTAAAIQQDVHRLAITVADRSNDLDRQTPIAAPNLPQSASYSDSDLLQADDDTAAPAFDESAGAELAH
ncbi:zeta toxin family protein [Dactylosporangium siamense]|uniref:UDP-N-acetylglucosamine kinase n=1 Tax=Dactylosporangium siamense TaxID=685454 RepID=A0A919PZ91_9ACTN|nr:zeta toxin family protein [Dactylosporangium siamense]GIG53152.1 hypothetical protein Dsi01nite_111930 [Dactylosporangium siamense]